MSGTVKCPRCTGPVTCNCTARQLEAWAEEYGPTGLGITALVLVRDALLARWFMRGRNAEAEPQQGRLFGGRP